MTKHGMRYTPEYQAWQAIKRRCYRQTSEGYERYGGRGITMCKEWKDSFTAFFAHIGSRPSSDYSIDRFPDPDGNYEPGNVRWATDKQQNRNRGDYNTVIEFKGESKTIAEWAESSSIPLATLRWRITRRGWPIERAMTEPAKLGRRPTKFSKFPNVRFHKSSRKYFAYQGSGKERRYVGSFDSAEDAALHTLEVPR